MVVATIFNNLHLHLPATTHLIPHETKEVRVHNTAMRKEVRPV